MPRPISKFCHSLVSQRQKNEAASCAFRKGQPLALSRKNSASWATGADATKLFCARAAEEISRSAIQVLGANGYSNAYPVSRLHRDAVLLSIGGGTDEALEKNISRLLTKPRTSIEKAR